MSEVSPTRVVLLGLALVGLGAVGFHEIPGMIAEDAEGTKIVNAIYCSVMTLTTVGFGDICPGEIAGPGRAFIVFLSFAGLGMFSGPIMDLAASWKDSIAGTDRIAILSFTVATGVFLFSYLLEEMDEYEAAYFSVITGTTIGYGDISPKSDAGKLAVALYAVLAVNVVASLLEPAKDYLLSFCLVPAPEKTMSKTTKGKKQSTTTDTISEEKAAANTEDKTDAASDEQKELDDKKEEGTTSKSKKKKKKKKGKNAGTSNGENDESKKDK